MSFSQSFRLAVKSLATSKMRALLTMLGIIIGVAAVIIIISLGDGMNDMINSEFEKMGTNLLQVQIMGRGTAQNIDEEAIYALEDENPDCIAAMSPSVSSMATVKQGSDTLSTTLTGVGEEYITVKSLELSQGRFIQYIDTARMQDVCVIGSYVNEESFNGAGLGEKLYINGNEYTVVGVLAEQADNTSYGGDNAVYIPYTNALRLKLFKPKHTVPQPVQSAPADGPAPSKPGIPLNPNQRRPHSNQNKGVSPMEKKIMIEGMMCQNCVKHVSNALNGLPGETANVDLEGKCATVSGPATDEELKKAVEEAGYQVVSIQ